MQSDESLFLCAFVLDFLTNRKQCVRVQNIQSPFTTNNTGSQQGCELSAFLFTICTNLSRSSYGNIHVIKYADNTFELGLINDNDDSTYIKKSH